MYVYIYKGGTRRLESNYYDIATYTHADDNVTRPM